MGKGWNPNNCGGNKACDKARKYCTPSKKPVIGPISLSNRPRQGGARLGMAFHLDLGTQSDTYRSLRVSQGFGALGVGVLFDAGGDDRYQCEAGCQGSALFGIGLLLDKAGNDRYRTYTQGQGFGYSTGVGHDYSTSWFIDDSGNDIYNAAGLTLGAGNENGYGFLIDNGGDDHYTARGNNSLGIAQGPPADDNPRNKQKVRTLGLFIDTGGKDTYKRPDLAKPANNKRWTQGRRNASPSRKALEDGVGVDGEGISTCRTK